MVAKASSVAEKPSERNCDKNQVKLPKNIHKSEREKLKRDSLNELFLELDEALESAQQNNGKALILCNAIKIIQGLVLQVESLRKENTALLSEERYVTLERNELKEEIADLTTEVGKMQDELREKHNPVWQTVASIPQPAPAIIPVQQTMGLMPVSHLPHPHDLHACQRDGADPVETRHVGRPQARYPNGSDSWPQEIFLEQQTGNQGEGRGSPTRLLNLF